MSEPTQSDNDSGWEFFSPSNPQPRRQNRIQLPEIIAIAVGILIAVGLVVFWPSGTGITNAKDDLDVLGIPSEFHEAVVQDVDEFACSTTDEFMCARVTFEILTGPDAGRLYSQEFPLIDTTPSFAVGAKVVLSKVSTDGTIIRLEEGPCEFDPESTCTIATVATVNGATEAVSLFPGQEQGLAVGGDVLITFETDGSIVAISPGSIQTTYQYADRQRRPFLLALVLVFALAVIALGRWRGLAALAGLGLSLIVVIWWLIPSLLDGNPPAMVAFTAAGAVAYLALYVSHGFSRMTTIALLGTVSAIALTTILAALSVGLGGFTGFTSEESTLLLLLDGVDVRSLLLAGIVIGAAGALDDVTVTQSASVLQIRHADPGLNARELFIRGMEIGKAHVGSIVNTLVLAYVGAALPLTILFVLADQSFGAAVNSEIVAVEVVRTIVGTLGIIAAVPLTTWFATLWPGSLEGHIH